MDLLLVVLRLVHILGGIFWVGSVILMTFFLMPAMATAGPAAGPVQAAMQKRGIMTVMPLVALATLLSGVLMIWRVSGGNVVAYARSSGGSAFTIAGGLALLGFILGMGFARPAAMRVGRLMQEMHQGPAVERPRLMEQVNRAQRQARIVSLVTTLLLIAAAAGMAVARYI